MSKPVGWDSLGENGNFTITLLSLLCAPDCGSEQMLCGLGVCACACLRERACVCERGSVCVSERERERVCVCVRESVCVCV